MVESADTAVATDRRRRQRDIRDDSGQGLIEYALIIALVSLAAVLALGFLSGKISTLFSKSGNVLNNLAASSGATGPPPPPPTAGTVNITCSGGGCDGGDTLTANTSGWTGVTTFTYSWRRNTSLLASCSTGSGWTTSGIPRPHGQSDYERRGRHPRGSVRGIRDGDERGWECRTRSCLRNRLPAVGLNLSSGLVIDRGSAVTPGPANGYRGRLHLGQYDVPCERARAVLGVRPRYRGVRLDEI